MFKLLLGSCLCLASTTAIAYLLLKSPHSSELVATRSQSQKTLIRSSLETISELDTVAQSAIVQIDVTEDNLLFNIKISETTAIYSLPGVVYAGVDASKIEFDDGVVTIPNATITKVEPDLQSDRLIVDRGILAPNTDLEISDVLQDQAIALLREQAIDDGVLDQAEKQAIAVVSAIVSPIDPDVVVRIAN